MSKSLGSAIAGHQATIDPETFTDWDPTATVAALNTNTSKIPSPSVQNMLKPKELSQTKSLQCLSRVKRDMLAIYNDPPPGIFVLQDEKDITLIHALITGSFDTPYEGGFFYFIVKCPTDYPIKPPKVKFMTTGGGTVRFNPNLYKCGKVCISILGTWSGPAWSPALTLSSVLISIQSLLTEKPYHNEPGFERERYPGDSARYNEIIQHETIRVAVCGMVENECGLTIPKPLIEAMNQSFFQFYDYYEAAVKSKLQFSGSPMQDPFGETRGKFEYNSLLLRLQALYAKLKINLTKEQRSPSISSGDSD